MAHSGDWDSLDGADTYYAYSWDFFRLYGRTLTTFAPRPASRSSSQTWPKSLGVPSDNSKTWTYKLRTGVKFEDGTPVTSKDVKYAVERTLDKDTFPNGPTYFNDFLDLQGYTSPYKDSDPQKLGLKAIETPDDQTIVFHLKQPFSGFDYLGRSPSTAPVPRAKDTGTKYKEHVVSTGPYKFESNQLGKKFVLVPQRPVGPGDRPEPEAAAGPHRGQPQRERRGHRQPAAGRRPRRRGRGHRCPAGDPGPGPRRPQPEEERRLRDTCATGSPRSTVTSRR
jgi:peptide/nickel transport system substrate-binding protein